jgi:uncharacterized membrane protein YraQ (UPF0718 family)
MSRSWGIRVTVSKRERPVSKRLRVSLLMAAIALPPFALPICGALVAHALGWRATYGAFAGGLATALLIGSVWIALGVYGARTEIRLCRQHFKTGRG